MENILFYIFSLCAIISGFLVISATNPINSVLSLVLTFANISFILILFNVEFLALLFLIVYVGAIAILFLFVIMMLDIKLEEIYDNSTRYIPFGFFIGILLIFEISIIAQDSTLPLLSIHNNILLDSSIISFTNIEVLGNYLYTDGFYQFLISSLVLLVAMIGAIVLTLYHSPEVRRQDLFSQVSTDYMETVKLRKNVIA